MARRAALSLTEAMRAALTTISRSRTESAARVRRAQILLAYSGGRRVTHIVREMGATRPLVERAIDKALAFDPLQALNDLPRPGRTPQVDDEAKSWVLSVACRKPTVCCPSISAPIARRPAIRC
jgi:hypothetical protein